MGKTPIMYSFSNGGRHKENKMTEEPELGHKSLDMRIQAPSQCPHCGIEMTRYGYETIKGGDIICRAPDCYARFDPTTYVKKEGEQNENV